MEEGKISEEAPVMGIGEGRIQEGHISPNISGLKEEQVKGEDAEAVGNATDSPQLFAQVTKDGDDTIEQKIEANGISIPQPIEQFQVPVMDNSMNDYVLEDEQFDMDQPTLPVLRSLDDLSMPDINGSIIDSEPRIQAYAKLEFLDGQFYMNTWAVELGRDVAAARRAQQQELEEPREQNNSSSKHRSNSSADGVQGATKRKEDLRKVAGSVISESGGILNFDPEGPPKPGKSSRRKAKSEGSASRIVSRSNSVMGMAMETESINPTDLLFDRPLPMIQPIMPQSLMPSPDDCPLIPIHPPAMDDGAFTGHRGISRRHAKIQYSFERRLFELEVKGRNGAFVDEIYYGAGEVAELRSGSYIQIGGVGVKFILPNVADGETGAEPTLASEAVSAMSFDFEDGRGESVAMAEMSDSSSEPPNSSDEERRARRRKARARRMAGSSEDESDDEEDEESSPTASGKKSQKQSKSGKGHRQVPRLKLKVKAQPKQPSEETSRSPGGERSPSAEVDEEALKALGIDVPLDMIPPRRKGPGRPPKNGFMSKREEASLKKQAREAAKAQAVADGTLPPEALLSPVDSSDRRKFLKKEKSDIAESIEGNDISPNQPAKLPKEKKPPKPPKSPSPFIDEASLTAEQLAKPQHSYVVMIHEALSNCPAGQMSLPQIYKAIERKYPYFKFKVTTPGWQSSIRHNLSQHNAFKKTETREGKGWMWCLDPDVSIEKEKRPRRPTPPPPTQQPYYPPGSQLYRPSFSYQNGQTNGPTPGQFPYPTAPGSYPPQPVRASNGVTPITANPPYPSPYIGDAAKSTNVHSTPQSTAPAGTNPYAGQQPRPQNQGQMRPPQGMPGQSFTNLSAQALSAITRYKSTLMESLPMPNRELIIDTVINKVLGKPVVEFTNIGDRTAAMAIEKPLIGLLHQIRDGEQRAIRDRQSHTPATPVQGNSHPPPPNGMPGASISAPSSTGGISAQAQMARPQMSDPPGQPGQSGQPVQTNQSIIPVAAKINENPAPAVAHQQPQLSKSDPSSINATQAATPIASPITPARAASPVAEIQTVSTAPSIPAPPITELSPPEDKKNLLSLLSQLGPSPPAPSQSPASDDASLRGTKRSRDEPATGMDSPRAKRVAV